MDVERRRITGQSRGALQRLSIGVVAAVLAVAAVATTATGSAARATTPSTLVVSGSAWASANVGANGYVRSPGRACTDRPGVSLFAYRQVTPTPFSSGSI